MSIECLIDHTGFHTFKSKGLPVNTYAMQGRELLQTIEILLLSDRVWLADTESQPTLNLTHSILEKLQSHGLTNNKPDGFVCLTPINVKEHKIICEEAASDVFDELHLIQESSWEKLSSREGLSVRPQNVLATNYPDVCNIPFESQQAVEFINKGLAENDWRATASLAHLNWAVYDWLTEFRKRFPNPQHNVYQILNTLFRWCINRRIAHSISEQYNNKNVVAYAPALGRATQLSDSTAKGWMHNKNQLDHASAKIIEAKYGKSNLSHIQTSLEASSSVELPLLGYWFLQKLPQNASFDHVFELINNMRSDECVITLKKYLTSPDSDEYELKLLDNKIRSELKLPKEKIKSNGKIKARFSILPIPYFQLFTELELNDEIANSNIFKKLSSRFRNRRLRSEAATVLVRMLESTEENIRLDTRLIEIVKSLNN